MTVGALAGDEGGWTRRLATWRDRKLADAGFRAWASQFPLTRPIARRRARALFDLCAGFAYSQVLQSCVSLRLFEMLEAGPQTPAQLASPLGLTQDRAARLLEAAAALRLLRRRGDAFGLGPLGAAMLNNPGVAAMVRHHAMLYADLADPVALLRAAPGHTLLAGYWPYGSAERPEALESGEVAGYSRLMAASLPLVAAQVLGAYDLRRHRCLLDIGGGEGAFLEAAAAAAPDLRLMLFDLPPVAERARARLGRQGRDVRRRHADRAAAGRGGRAVAGPGDPRSRGRSGARYPSHRAAGARAGRQAAAGRTDARFARRRTGRCVLSHSIFWRWAAGGHAARPRLPRC